MLDNRTVLVVATTPKLARRLDLALGASGHHTVIATTFHAAKSYLESKPTPCLIVSELKLGAFNGLHVALRGQAFQVPAIVIGDESFEREAEQLGVTFLAERELSDQALHTAAAKVIEASQDAPTDVPWQSLVTQAHSLAALQTDEFPVIVPSSATIH
jgi:DNA-binding NtrC family response regulator